MPIKRIIKCDICGKEEEYDCFYREEWIMEAIDFCICSEECFDKFINKEMGK